MQVSCLAKFVGVSNALKDDAVITMIISNCRLPGDTELQHTPMVEAQAPSHATTAGNLRHAQFEHATVHWVRFLAMLAESLQQCLSHSV